MTTPSAETVKRYGKPGDRIPGSRYLRAYCGCGEPIRVTEAQAYGSCERCNEDANATRRSVNAEKSAFFKNLKALDTNE